jgi:hypothetical protein
MNRVVLRNVLASISIYIATYLFLLVVGEVGSPFSLIPPVASLGSPSLGVAFAALMPVLVSYLSGRYAYALIFLPLSLLIIFKNVQSWRSATLVLLSSLLTALAPGVLPIVLGIALSQASEEDYREALSSGVVFSLALFILSGVRFENSSIVYFLRLPGGVYSSVSLNAPISAASLFYLELFKGMMSNPFLLGSFLGIVSGFIVTSVSSKPGRMRSILLGGIVMFAPSLGYSFNFQDSLIGLGLMLSSGLIVSSLGKVSFPRIKLHRRRGREEGVPPKIDLDFVFRDIREAISRAGEVGVCTGIAHAVVVGFCGEDEEYVAGVLRDALRRGVQIHMLHREGKEGIVSLPTDKTIVVYIPPLSWEEFRDTLTFLTGFPGEVFEGLDLRDKMRVPRMCRAQIAAVATTMLELIERGYSARRAFESAISSQEPRVGEDFFHLLEYLASQFRVLGFRGGGEGVGNSNEV